MGRLAYPPPATLTFRKPQFPAAPSGVELAMLPWAMGRLYSFVFVLEFEGPGKIEARMAKPAAEKVPAAVPAQPATLPLLALLLLLLLVAAEAVVAPLLVAEETPPPPVAVVAGDEDDVWVCACSARLPKEPRIREICGGPVVAPPPSVNLFESLLLLLGACCCCCCCWFRF